MLNIDNEMKTAEISKLLTCLKLFLLAHTRKIVGLYFLLVGFSILALRHPVAKAYPYTPAHRLSATGLGKLA